MSSLSLKNTGSGFTIIRQGKAKPWLVSLIQILDMCFISICLNNVLLLYYLNLNLFLHTSWCFWILLSRALPYHIFTFNIVHPCNMVRTLIFLFKEFIFHILHCCFLTTFSGCPPNWQRFQFSPWVWERMKWFKTMSIPSLSSFPHNFFLSLWFWLIM